MHSFSHNGRQMKDITNICPMVSIVSKFGKFKTLILGQNPQILKFFSDYSTNWHEIQEKNYNTFQFCIGFTPQDLSRNIH